MKATTIDIDQMVALRDYHLAEARKVDDALTIIRDVTRRARKATKLVSKVQAKATRAVPYSSRKGKDGMTPAVRARVARENGTRPTDLLRKQFHTSKKPLTRAYLLEHSGIVDANAGQTARIVGLALRNLVNNKEIKETKTGYVAYKLQPVAAPTANGASANA